ncbi:MAG TPA: response regulator transcription factor [Syntrophomonas sp.]|nr:response regulator transcription factor [Syntrophomonas sp.]
MNDKILIIEDEPQIARYIQLELKHEGYQVEITYDGRDGLHRIQQAEPDLVLLDVMLPGIDGMEVCRRVRQFSQVAIIMLTSRDQTADKVRGLDLGADDYVSKLADIEELLARIRAVLRNKRNQARQSKLLAIEGLVMDTERHTAFRDGRTLDLTKREYDLLEYLLINQNIALTREQILENVWGYDFMGDTNVVDVYVRYLRSKMDDSFDTKLIHTVRGVGYMIKADGE